MSSPINYTNCPFFSSPSSTPSGSIQGSAKTPDFDPFAAFKEQMRTAHEARIMATSAAIEANYGRGAAIAWEMGQGVIRAPVALLAIGSEESGAVERGGSVYPSASEIEGRVSFILGSEEPQKVLDRMECEDEVERKVWGAATRALRGRRENMSKSGAGTVVFRTD